MKSGTTTNNRAPDDGAKEGDGKRSGDADDPPKPTPETDSPLESEPVPLSDPFAEPEHEGAELEPVP
jgi:hypothetical protein